MCRKKQRKKPRMQVEDFLWAYADAVQSGMTREKFAESIGVLTATVYQRVYELNCDGHRITQLPLRDVSHQRTVADTLREIRKIVRI